MKKKILPTNIILGAAVLLLLLGFLVSFYYQRLPSQQVLLYPKPTQITEKQYPAEVLDLTNWKITVPTGSSEHPTEIKQPTLSTYVLDPWFVISPDKTGIRFRAPVSAVTTSGSNYPRSELREMTNNGTSNASWSSTVGTHTMEVDEAITAVPKVKQHVVAGQIHDNHDDIIVIRLEYPNLYVNVGGKNVYTLDKNYKLGKRFQFKFVVTNGKTDVFYNNSTNPVYTLSKNYANSYFKAGVYTQSNCMRENNPSFCKENNFGEVIIYRLSVSHS